MRCSKGIVAACLSFVAFSIWLLYLAYLLVEDAIPVAFSDDTFEILQSILFVSVAIWGIATTVGVLRLRRWGRISALWLSIAAFVVYIPSLAKYIYVVRTAPDVG